MLTSSDGLRCPMNEQDFFHWIAKHGKMPLGTSPEGYITMREIAWKAYLRGKKDQAKATKKRVAK